jgi:hypothetical protein
MTLTLKHNGCTHNKQTKKCKNDIRKIVHSKPFYGGANLENTNIPSFVLSSAASTVLINQLNLEDNMTIEEVLIRNWEPLYKILSSTNDDNFVSHKQDIIKIAQKIGALTLYQHI